MKRLIKEFGGNMFLKAVNIKLCLVLRFMSWVSALHVLVCFEWEAVKSYELKKQSLIFLFGSNTWFYHKLLKASCSCLIKRPLPFIVSMQLPILFTVEKG